MRGFKIAIKLKRLGRVAKKLCDMRRTVYVKESDAQLESYSKAANATFLIERLLLDVESGRTSMDESEKMIDTTTGELIEELLDLSSFLFDKLYIKK